MWLGKVDISFAASAVSDLEKTRNWYVDQGVPDVGKRLIGGIFQRVELDTDFDPTTCLRRL